MGMSGAVKKGVMILGLEILLCCFCLGWWCGMTGDDRRGVR
jgi:hypothetical protein